MAVGTPDRTDEAPLRETRTRTFGRCAVLILVFAVAHSVVYHESHFGNDMTKAVLDMSCALVETGSVSIDEVHTNASDISYYDGRYHSGMAPGLSVFCVPIRAVAKAGVKLPSGSSRQRLTEER